MKNSKIEWTNDTWNPIRGCSRVSKGCEHCYAETVAHRFGGPGQPYEGLTVVGANGEPRWNGTIKLIEDHLMDPLRWKKPRRIFVNSMSDLFHEGIPFDFIDKVFAVMALTPQHTYQILTKRPERMREYMNALQDGRLGHINEQIRILLTKVFHRNRVEDSKFPWAPRILDNVWLGVSIEDQTTYNERMPILLDTPSIVRWVSMEPLLGPINDLKGLEKLAWVVVGGESGAGARPMHQDWVIKIRNLCVLVGVPFFFKQWGEYLPWSQDNGSIKWDAAAFYQPCYSFGDEPEGNFLRKNLAVKVGKKAAGRILDGRTWDEYPELRA